MSYPTVEILIRRGALALAMTINCSTAIAQVDPAQCGPLRSEGQYGPWDYRTDKKMLVVVEQFHFQPSVEALMRNPKTGPPGGDIDYTLRASPNHHRALMALVRFGELHKSDKLPDVTYVLECYFERAIRFKADDVIVRMIYATYLSKKARIKDALDQLKFAEALSVDSPLTTYNIGLIYFDMQEYEKAVKKAHEAIALGLNRTELKDQLLAAGKWFEPVNIELRAKP